MQYLTVTQLSERIHYHPKYINQTLRDSVLLEGIHYVRPFGGKKILYLWDTIEREFMKSNQNSSIPLLKGGVCRG